MSVFSHNSSTTANSPHIQINNLYFNTNTPSNINPQQQVKQQTIYDNTQQNNNYNNFNMNYSANQIVKNNINNNNNLQQQQVKQPTTSIQSLGNIEDTPCQQGYQNSSDIDLNFQLQLKQMNLGDNTSPLLSQQQQFNFQNYQLNQIKQNNGLDSKNNQNIINKMNNGYNNQNFQYQNQNINNNNQQLYNTQSQQSDDEEEDIFAAQINEMEAKRLKQNGNQNQQSNSMPQIHNNQQQQYQQQQQQFIDKSAQGYNKNLQKQQLNLKQQQDQNEPTIKKEDLSVIEEYNQFNFDDDNKQEILDDNEFNFNQINNYNQNNQQFTFSNNQINQNMLINNNNINNNNFQQQYNLNQNMDTSVKTEYQQSQDTQDIYQINNNVILNPPQNINPLKEKLTPQLSLTVNPGEDNGYDDEYDEDEGNKSTNSKKKKSPRKKIIKIKNLPSSKLFKVKEEDQPYSSGKYSCSNSYNYLPSPYSPSPFNSCSPKKIGSKKKLKRINTSHVPLNMLNSLYAHLIKVYSNVECKCTLSAQKIKEKQLLKEQQQSSCNLTPQQSQSQMYENTDNSSSENVKQNYFFNFQPITEESPLCRKCHDLEVLNTIKKNPRKNIETFRNLWQSSIRLQKLTENFLLHYAAIRFMSNTLYRSADSADALYRCLPTFLNGSRNYQHFYKLQA